MLNIDPEMLKKQENKEKKLQSIEQELKKYSSQLERDKENFDKELESAIQKEKKELKLKQKELSKIIKICNTSESFEEFYSYIDKMYNLYVASRGNSEGLLETIKLIIAARDNFSLINSKKKI